MDPTLPATLSEAMGAEPAWLRAWVMVMVVTHFAAVLFIVKREDGRFGVRLEPIAMLASFVAAALFMDWIYGQVGYVRLLGGAHLVFWTPAWLFVASRARQIGRATVFGWYVHAYLLIAGTSLVVDAVDVIRWALGDGALLGR